GGGTLGRVVPHQQVMSVGAEREAVDTLDRGQHAAEQIDQRQLAAKRLLLLAQLLLLRFRDAYRYRQPLRIRREPRRRAEGDGLRRAVRDVAHADLVLAAGAVDRIDQPAAIRREAAALAGRREPL